MRQDASQSASARYNQDVSHNCAQVVDRMFAELGLWSLARKKFLLPRLTIQRLILWPVHPARAAASKTTG